MEDLPLDRTAILVPAFAVKTLSLGRQIIIIIIVIIIIIIIIIIIQ